ncbi:MAG: N-acetylmuramoyl-L-alanine amidase [Candidatus Solibacter sp.]|jgi:N-acetylmuramoyl-L-alanine amidase
MKPLAALAISATMLFAQNERAPVHSVTAIRHWSLTEITRVAVEVSGEFHFRTDRLHNPERVYFDILNARPRLDAKRTWSTEIGDKLVQRVRVAETNPGTTRIVLDLAGPVEVSTSQLSNPNRLIIELHPGSGPVIPTGPEPGLPAVKPPPVIRAGTAEPVPPPVKRPEAEPPVAAPKPETPAVIAEAEPLPVKPRTTPPVKGKSAPTAKSKPAPPVVVAEAPPAEPSDASAESRGAAEPAVLHAEPPVPAASAPPAPSPGEFGKAARRTSTGGNSLTRALGLKVGRIVIDAGHGGHDQGTEGPHGLVEKELVLDVAQRVGKLIEERLNAEVIYTRSDDTFVPLEGRTAIANQKKADLFLSIHANSSPYPRISGMETFYLNFTDSKDALDVAARENASSQKSIFELQDIIQKITLHEKLDESREFASRIQGALFSFSSRNMPGQKNRGVKKAPFVVLIGANMPSVLAEIGFLSNPREESLLKKSDYRQKLAESLYRGVAKYAESLSHFQLAAN